MKKTKKSKSSSNIYILNNSSRKILKCFFSNFQLPRKFNIFNSFIGTFSFQNIMLKTLNYLESHPLLLILSTSVSITFIAMTLFSILAEPQLNLDLITSVFHIVSQCSSVFPKLITIILLICCNKREAFMKKSIW